MDNVECLLYELMKAVVLRCVTSWPVATLWVVLSTLVAVTSLFSVSHPTWFIGVERVGVGPLMYCRGALCHAWPTPHMSSVLYGGGGAALGLAALGAGASVLVRDVKWRHLLITYVGYLQIAASKYSLQMYILSK